MITTSRLATLLFVTALSVGALRLPSKANLGSSDIAYVPYNFPGSTNFKKTRVGSSDFMLQDNNTHCADSEMITTLDECQSAANEMMIDIIEHGMVAHTFGP